MGNYSIEERKYVILFTFETRSEAQQFRLPKKYLNKYVLNDSISEEGKKEFIRVAQCK